MYEFSNAQVFCVILNTMNMLYLKQLVRHFSAQWYRSKPDNMSSLEGNQVFRSYLYRN